MPDDLDLGGPWLQAAVFCEKVLQERDGVVSLIRVVDRFIITGSGEGAPERMPPTNISVSGVLMFKSGFAKGSYTVKLVLNSPSRTQIGEMLLPMFLEGDDRGVSLAFNMTLSWEEGLYWMDVRVGETLVTRMPLRIVYQRIQTSPPRARQE